MNELADIYRAGENDIVMQILAQLFPSLFGADHVTAIGVAVTTLAAFVTLFAAGVVAYLLIVGTLESAHEGQILGRKWSSLWVPLRIAFGFLLLIPLGSVGWTGAHALTSGAVQAGVGLANTVWDRATAHLFDSQPLAIPTQTRSREVAMTTLLNLTCTTTYKGTSKNVAVRPDCGRISGVGGMTGRS